MDGADVPSPSASIAVIDLASHDVDAAESALLRAASSDGTAWLIGHGVDAEVLRRARAFAGAFFDRPREEKLRVASVDGVRGYRPIPEVRGGDDRKECYFCEQGMSVGASPGSPLAGVNLWPELPGFEPAMRAALEQVEALGLWIVGALERKLGAPEAFSPAFRDRAGIGLRILRYPAFDGDAGWLGANEHVDLPALGLLEPGDVPGLEVRDEAGVFRAVEPRPGALLLQIGALLERWTNGVLRACVHRVVLEAPRERDSLAFFYQPALDARIECLASCAGPGRPTPKPPVSYREYFERWIGAMEERSMDGALLDAETR